MQHFINVKMHKKKYDATLADLNLMPKLCYLIFILFATAIMNLV